MGSTKTDFGSVKSTMTHSLLLETHFGSVENDIIHVGIMIQVFSLMVTHSDERSQYNMLTTKNYKSDYKE